MRCVECERIREIVRDRNRVFLSFPTAFTYEKARAGIDGAALAFTVGPGPRCISFDATPDELRAICAGLSRQLSSEERAHSRALVLPADNEPTLGEYLGTLSVDQLVAVVDGLRLVELIEGDRLFSALQPIFRPDRSLFGHEALLRGRELDGSVIPAGPLLAAAAETELLFTVDMIARRLALDTHARAGSGAIFVNFDPASIYDPTYCLRETEAYVRQLGLEPKDVIFEVTESGEVRDRDHLRRILRFYREAGFRVALDDVGAGFAGLSMLLEVQPDVIKIDMELMRGVDRDRYRQSVVGHLIGIARDVGALSVAEGIETEAEMAWAVDAGVDLLQGFLLGRPYIPDDIHRA
jgi:EAL domain-containing protein (putative c-di-GMP-specific phosphodiesterase class I)